MSVISSKWGIAALLLLFTLLLLLVIGRKSVRASVFIAAKPQQVWSVLTDTRQAKIWNKVLVPVQGSLSTGNHIDYAFYTYEGSKPSTIRARVNQVILDSLINQSGGLPGLLTFDHYYVLHSTDSGTQVEIKEAYRGIMVPFWNPQPVEEAYKRLLLALKEQVQQSTIEKTWE